MLKKLWLGIGVALLFLIVMNLLCAISFALFAKTVPTDSEKRLSSDAYAGVAWAKDYGAEHDASEVMRWEPYVYWRRLPFHGKYIEVDSRGLRRTVQSKDDGTAPRPKIFMFGGSTMWGTGVRDEGTLPSQLAAELARRGVVADLVNYGESGYVCTQELIQFEIELREGRVPSIAIFLDGVNDAFSTFQQDRAGIPQNEVHREREFNLVKTKRLDKLQATAFTRTLEDLALVRALSLVFKRKESSLSLTPFYDDDDLARMTASAYLNDLRAIVGLAREFHCEALAYLQPTVFQKDVRSHSEVIAAERDAKLGKFLSSAYEQIRAQAAARPVPDWHDLAGIFAGVDAALFLDWCHLGEEGNRRLAIRIADDVVAKLKRS